MKKELKETGGGLLELFGSALPAYIMIWVFACLIMAFCFFGAIILAAIWTFVGGLYL